jgi:hypothetical protein
MAKRSDVTTRMVLAAVAEHRFGAMSVLAERYPWKVVERAFEREVAAGRLNYGISLRGCWLEPKGSALLASMEAPTS